MYECKLPFNSCKKFGDKFTNIEVKYLSKWELLSKDSETTVMVNDKFQVSLPTDKFDVHFREL